MFLYCHALDILQSKISVKQHFLGPLCYGKNENSIYIKHTCWTQCGCGSEGETWICCIGTGGSWAKEKRSKTCASAGRCSYWFVFLREAKWLRGCRFWRIAKNRAAHSVAGLSKHEGSGNWLRIRGGDGAAKHTAAVGWSGGYNCAGGTRAQEAEGWLCCSLIWKEEQYINHHRNAKWSTANRLLFQSLYKSNPEWSLNYSFSYCCLHKIQI